MSDETDEAFLMGQAAGIVAVMSALVQASPLSTRKRMLLKLGPQFESLISAMRTTGLTEAHTERKGAEWVRDLFLRQVGAANKPNSDRSLSPAREAVDIEF